MKDVFTEIYHKNYWKGESRSGRGSGLKATAAIRLILPQLLDELGVQSVLDIPCGDCFWVQSLDFFGRHYIGADVVTDMIASNRQKFPDIDFRTLDITADPLPDADLILCRDLLGHFSDEDLLRAVRNIKRSGATWLLATTFPEHENGNVGIETGQWRPVNLDDWWVGLGAPVSYIFEDCTDGDGEFKDKALGLWRLRGR